MDETRVPPDLREVLVLASLFSTGEVGIWHEFFEALDDKARKYIVDTVERCRGRVNVFIRSQGRRLSQEAYVLMDLVRMYDYLDEGEAWSVGRRPNRTA